MHSPLGVSRQDRELPSGALEQVGPRRAAAGCRSPRCSPRAVRQPPTPGTEAAPRPPGSTSPHRRPLIHPIRQGDEFSSRRKSISENA
jgi:hypothetical protein